MKIYSHSDLDAKSILEKVSKYTKQAEAMNIPYWVFAENLNPIGIVAVGKEPIKLLASPGTPIAILYLVDVKQPKEKVKVFISEALNLASKHNIAYALAVFPFRENEAMNIFKDANFQEFDDAYQMVCSLNEKEFKPFGELQFYIVQREEMCRFIEFAAKFLQGAPDITLTKMLEHLLEVPKDFLDFYYNMEKFYLANKNDETVGIVNFNPKTGLISNIGVDEKHRGKGYGRQIMLFALSQLKESSCRQARLRVHVENKPAIHLYKTLGFIEIGQYKTLIWKEKSA